MNYDTLIGTLSGLLMTQYLPNITDMVQEVGTPTMQKIGWDSTLATQGDNVLRIKIGAADSARPNSNTQADFSAPNASRTDSLTFKYLPASDDPNAQEFRAINTSARITAADMDQVKNGSKSQEDLARIVVDDAVNSLNKAPSFMVHSDKTGRLGTVSAKKAAGLSYTAAAGYTTATSASILLGEHSIGAIKRDLILDIYTSAGVLVANAVRVVRVDPVNDAFVIESTADTTAADLDAVVATCVIYRSGAKGHGFSCAFNEIVKDDYSGDASSAWLRKDRALAANYHFVPEYIHRQGLSASPATVEISHLTELANGMEPVKGHDNALAKYSAFMGVRMLQTIREDTDDSLIRVVDGTTDSSTRKVGATKIVFTHPVLGDIELEGDPTAREDRMLLLPMEQFKWWGAGSKDMRVFTGSGRGVFDRVEGTRADGGGTKEYKFEADKVMSLKCDRFDNIGAVLNLTA